MSARVPPVRQRIAVLDRFARVANRGGARAHAGGARVLEATQPKFKNPIVTTVEPAKPFWRAEEYHQCYLQKRRDQGGLLNMLMGR